MCQHCPTLPSQFTRSVKITSPSALETLKEYEKAKEETGKLSQQFIASQKRLNAASADLVRKLHEVYPEVVSPSMLSMQILQFEGHNYYCCQDREEAVQTDSCFE